MKHLLEIGTREFSEMMGMCFIVFWVEDIYVYSSILRPLHFILCKLSFKKKNFFVRSTSLSTITDHDLLVSVIFLVVFTLMFLNMYVAACVCVCVCVFSTELMLRQWR